MGAHFKPTEGVMDKRKMVLGAAIVATAFAAGIAVGAQPHMEAALRALETAKAELAVAEHNKGGHRDKAMKAVNEAIAQTKRGIAYAGK
jgi:hypothetical protein